MFYKIDTGTQFNLARLKINRKFKPQFDLHPVNQEISPYKNCNIPVIRKCSHALEKKIEQLKVSFLVVDTESLPILGLEL